VAESQTLSRRIGLTRGKAVLIGVLAVALVGVLYIQFGSGDDEIVPLAAQAPQPSQPQATPNQNTEAPSGTAQELELDAEPALAVAFDQTRWRSPDLSTVTAYDPFALPESFPRPPQVEGDPRLVIEGSDATVANADAEQLAKAIEELRMELETLQQRGVQVIIRGRDQYVAMIGDRMVHVGDEINGFTVTAIEPDGVRVERKVDQ
jgi:hypothetical protein